MKKIDLQHLQSIYDFSSLNKPARRKKKMKLILLEKAYKSQQLNKKY